MFTNRGTVAFATLAATAALALAACGGDDDKSSDSGSGAAKSSEASTGLKPINSGQLTVGMNLQFKPEMYLDNGKPAGYDVDLLNELAPALKAKLNIQNLDFNGLIPGLVAKKFDMVSVGLSPTPERKKAISFSRSYVPYALILAVPGSDKSPGTVAAWNDSSKTITALQGSTDADLVKKVFPKAKLATFPDDTAALLQVA